MLIVPALEYEKQRQQPDDWNKVILHREGKKGGRGKDTKPRGGAFTIVSKLLAYPVERKSSSENVEFISELKELAAELL